MTNEINHTNALMNLITVLVVLGGVGILWMHFLEWMNNGKQPQKSVKAKRKRTSAKKMKVKRVR